jgi:hypothetical protein
MTGALNMHFKCGMREKWWNTLFGTFVPPISLYHVNSHFRQVSRFVCTPRNKMQSFWTCMDNVNWGLPSLLKFLHDTY